MIYSHSNHKVARSLGKAKCLCHGDGTNIRDKRLNYENDGNDGKVGKLVNCKLGGQLDEDYSNS